MNKVGVGSELEVGVCGRRYYLCCFRGLLDANGTKSGKNEDARGERKSAPTFPDTGPKNLKKAGVRLRKRRSDKADKGVELYKGSPYPSSTSIIIHWLLRGYS